MSILLSRRQIVAILPFDSLRGVNIDNHRLYCGRLVAKAQLKEILIKLQAIYNLPDEGMFHKRLGEFIKSLMEEVK